MLGGAEANGIDLPLEGEDQAIDQTLEALYDAGRSGGLGDSAPKVGRWLGDIRRYFPASVVQVMQRDALERLDLHQMLLEPELLAAVEPDVHLVANLISLSSILPAETRATARQVVAQLVADLQRRLMNPMRQAITGSLNRAIRNPRPRHNEIDWERTIQVNLKHYQPEYRTIVPATRIGQGRRRSSLHDVILCLDQSASMATSVVYAGILGAVLASLPALRTQLIAFDTSVVDLTAELADPVELLFGIQLGGGTDINRALTYAQQLVRQPRHTTLVLITDLYEGGDREALLKRAAGLVRAGVQVIVLLALSDEGASAFNADLAAAMGSLNIPAFACSPDQFPALMAVALKGQNLAQWAATEGIVTHHSGAGEDR